MSELELILSLAHDVENLLRKAGVLGALEKHPVVQEIENLLDPNFSSTSANNVAAKAQAAADAANAVAQKAIADAQAAAQAAQVAAQNAANVAAQNVQPVNNAGTDSPSNA